METMTRPALERKKLPELKAIIRRMGADSQQGESRESLIDRILLFAPPQQFKPEEKKPYVVVQPVTEAALREALKLFIDDGMILVILDDTWEVCYGKCRESGTLRMPLKAIRRHIELFMRGAKMATEHKSKAVTYNFRG